MVFKIALLQDHALCAQTRMWESTGAKELRELQWEAALERALGALRQSEQKLRRQPKSCVRKLAIAAWVKSRTQASNGWLSSRLGLGAPAAFSRNLTHFRRRLQATDPTWKRLASISAA